MSDDGCVERSDDVAMTVSTIDEIRGKQAHSLLDSEVLCFGTLDVASMYTLHSSVKLGLNMECDDVCPTS